MFKLLSIVLISLFVALVAYILIFRIVNVKPLPQGSMFSQISSLDQNEDTEGVNGYGYGRNYHILGNKAYVGNNDPNDLYTVGNSFDDYKIWHSSKNGDTDFEVNPIYGLKLDGDSECTPSVHLAMHNPLNQTNLTDDSICYKNTSKPNRLNY